jgi:hypothetical protein
VVLVELSAESVATTDITNRYFTIETFEITDIWALWPNKVLLLKGTIGPFYSRQVDLPPGPNTIWVGVTVLYPGVYWTFRIRAKVVATGQVFADITSTHDIDSNVRSYTINVPNVPSGGGGGATGTTPFDPSQIIQQMMNQMLPPMMQMMSMMMVMNMMVSMIQGMASAFAGGF